MAGKKTSKKVAKKRSKTRAQVLLARAAAAPHSKKDPKPKAKLEAAMKPGPVEVKGVAAGHAPAAERGKRKQIPPAPGLPLFESRELVQGFKIHRIDSMTNGCWKLCGLDHFVIVDSIYIDQYRPKVGGYYVQADSGVRSWQTATAFEAMYTPAD